MLLLGQKTYTKDAEAQYKNFLTKYPNSRWKSLLDAHMGKLAALAGKKNLAKKYYLASGIIATEAMKYYITRKNSISKGVFCRKTPFQQLPTNLQKK